MVLQPLENMSVCEKFNDIPKLLKSVRLDQCPRQMDNPPASLLLQIRNTSKEFG